MPAFSSQAHTAGASFPMEGVTAVACNKHQEHHVDNSHEKKSIMLPNSRCHHMILLLLLPLPLVDDHLTWTRKHLPMAVPPCPLATPSSHIAAPTLVAILSLADLVSPGLPGYGNLISRKRGHGVWTFECPSTRLPCHARSPLKPSTCCSSWCPVTCPIQGQRVVRARCRGDLGYDHGGWASSTSAAYVEPGPCR